MRIIVDKLTTAKTALDTERYTYTETEVALVKLPHRPGELARAVEIKTIHSKITSRFQETIIDAAPSRRNPDVVTHG